MRSVRCDVCGTKALIAASQCPKCGHLFEMRDGSGEPLPVAHCASCDSYYPAHVHSCKWCGTTLTVEKVRKDHSATARWIAAAVFLAAVWLGSHARDPRPRVAARPRESAQSKAQTTSADTAARIEATTPVGAVIPRDTANPLDAAKPRDTTEGAGDVVLSEVSVPGPPTSTPARDATIPQATRPSTAASIPVVTPIPAAPATVPPKPRSSSPWVSMVAKQWVIVRSNAQGSAHIVASVGPASRVQLGESRGSWRRIRARGIAGWVDVSRASFVASPSSPRRARGVAAR